MLLNASKAELRSRKLANLSNSHGRDRYPNLWIGRRNLMSCFSRQARCRSRSRAWFFLLAINKDHRVNRSRKCPIMPQAPAHMATAKLLCSSFKSWISLSPKERRDKAAELGLCFEETVVPPRTYHADHVIVLTVRALLCWSQQMWP